MKACNASVLQYFQQLRQKSFPRPLQSARMTIGPGIRPVICMSLTAS
jgi:hypothetical protein